MANHLCLNLVELLGTHIAVVDKVLVVLLFEWLVLLVFINEHTYRGAYNRVEHTEFPILLIVDLAKAGQRK